MLIESSLNIEQGIVPVWGVYEGDLTISKKAIPETAISNA
jgi:hypothetical protein